MRYCITIIMLLTFCYVGRAQDGPKLSIGEKGNQFPITNQPVSERVTTAVFRSDPKLYVNGGKNDYMIAQYDVSVVVNENNIAGPFTVEDNNSQEVFDKLYRHFEMGAKIFYDKILLVCKDCIPPKQVAAPGIAVVLE